MGVTAPLALQSNEDGRFVTFSYLNLMVVKPLYMDREVENDIEQLCFALNPSLVKSAYALAFKVCNSRAFET